MSFAKQADAPTFQHGFDCDGLFGDLNIHLEYLTVRTLQLYVRHLKRRNCQFDRRVQRTSS